MLILCLQKDGKVYAVKLSPDNLSGIEMIDRDHELLMSICNELFETQNRLGAHDQIEALLKRLLNHLEQHFKSEEDFHRGAGYHKAQSHQEEHRDLLIKTRSLMGKHKNGILSFGDLYKFIALEVVKEHLEIQDKDFHTFIKK